VTVQRLLTSTLLLLGAGFLVANALRVAEYVRYLNRRRGALLTWKAAKPRYYWMGVGIGVVLGVLVMIKLWVYRGAFRRGDMTKYPFGEAMMFVYYAYLVPLTARIQRGFYAEGIWSDAGFIPYGEVGGISWKEGEHEARLVIISRLRDLARPLTVPGDKYGAARRVLRDKIGEHAIQFYGTGLNLGGHDEREDV
jgi:hypothetical protein